MKLTDHQNKHKLSEHAQGMPQSSMPQHDFIISSALRQAIHDHSSSAFIYEGEAHSNPYPNSSLILIIATLLTRDKLQAIFTDFFVLEFILCVQT